MKKLLKIMSNTITILLIASLLLMTFLVISSKSSKGEAQIFGYQLKTVFSGSMEPTFLTGSVIAVKPLNSDGKGTLKKGEIITFQKSKNLLVTHRIIGVIKSGEHIMYETKGDHNKTSDMDPVLSQNVVAKYSGFTIPYLGYIQNFLQAKNGSAILLIVSGIFFLGYSVFTFFQVMKELNSKTNSKEGVL